eukprot:jgi/Mesen1/6408/ME000329S05571
MSLLMGGTRLRDMIRAVRACKTAAEERAVIAKECASLRNSFKENDQDYRHRNVAKLMFIHMLGYPTHFGQMECLKLIASPGFPEKRIGYLGLMLLLDERQEVLMLVTNSLKNDLNHTNQFISGLALCALGNICSAEMARDLSPEVERLLNSNNSYVRKKAALCSIRIIRKVPELVEYFTSPASGLLTDKHHGVLLGGVKLATELCNASPYALEHFRKQTPTLVRILKNLVISGYAPEYDVGGITDPFLQIRVLRLLRLVGKGDPESSDIMSDVLAQVATNTEASKTAGNAILYECVSTIMGVEAIGGLRVLAINILGRFLAHRENNVRYVALNTLVKVVAIDTQAVQRHRNTIVECVKDSDISIRRRALDLVYALVNEHNIKVLTKELLEYLKVSDFEFKPDLTAKICALVQRFSPSKLWHIDIMIRVMVEAGQYMEDEVVRYLLVLITNAPELHGYTVRAFYRHFQQWKGQESLSVVTAWCIGEYGEMLINHQGELEGEEPLTVTESDVVDVMEGILKGPLSTGSARAYALTGLLKLTSRFPSCTERIKGLIEQHKGSLVLELQQRSVEFTTILSKHDKIKDTLVDRMPALDEAAYRAKKSELASASLPDMRMPTDSPATSPTRGKANGTMKPPVPQAPLLADLLDLSMDDDAPAAPPHAGGGDALLDVLGGGFAPAAANASSSSRGGADMLLDLLSLGDSAPAAAPAPASAASSDPLSAAFPNLNSQPASSSSGPLDPLSALMGDGAPSQHAPAATPAPVPAPRAANADPFADLGLSAPAAAAPAPAPAPALPAALGPIIAMEAGGMRIKFSFEKTPGNPQGTVITATYSNSTSTPFTDFVFQAAVPKFMQLQLEPASGSVVPASSTDSVTQVLRVTNTMHGQKSLVMKLRVSYKLDGVEKLEQGQVNNFPPGS